MHKGRQEVLKITEPNKQKEKSSPEVYLVNDFINLFQNLQNHQNLCKFSKYNKNFKFSITFKGKIP